MLMCLVVLLAVVRLLQPSKKLESSKNLVQKLGSTKIKKGKDYNKTN